MAIVEKEKVKKIFLLIIISIFLIILALFLIRLFNHKELDDLTIGINCQESLINKADVLWVIPEYKNFPVSQNQTWCSYILSFNKTIGMHGVTHEYNEFGLDRNQSYLDDGMKIFEDCFKFKPTIFKAPQLNITENNKNLIRKNMKLEGPFNQFIHKVYHCNDSDTIKNRFIDIF